MANPHLSRRTFLRAAAAGTGAALALRAGLINPARTASAAPALVLAERHHSFVWQFTTDGSPAHIRDTLAAAGMAIMLKSHDGSEFMRRWDIPPSIASAEDVRQQATFFEAGGVPFHAWCVVEGVDPIREARICSDVLTNGARSLTLDLEAKDGKNFWQGGTEEARAFGNELRRLQPQAWISVAPDPRPWQVESVPMQQFAAFANEIAPQTYWCMFANGPTRDLYAARGRFVDLADMTPEWFLDQSLRDLQQYNLPIRPIGQGDAPADEWRRFIAHADRLGMSSTGIWRHGITSSEVFATFRDSRQTQPGLAPALTATPPADSSASRSSAPRSGAWQRFSRPSPRPAQ